MKKPAIEMANNVVHPKFPKEETTVETVGTWEDTDVRTSDEQWDPETLLKRPWTTYGTLKG
jgi:hypothetical protein